MVIRRRLRGDVCKQGGTTFVIKGGIIYILFITKQVFAQDIKGQTSTLPPFFFPHFSGGDAALCHLQKQTGSLLTGGEPVRHLLRDINTQSDELGVFCLEAKTWDIPAMLLL